MFIKKEVVVNAIYYNNNKEEVMKKFPNINRQQLDAVINGNYIVINSDNTLYSRNPQEFNREYVKIDQVINNITYNQTENIDNEPKDEIIKENIVEKK